MNCKAKLEESALTEEDLAISFSRDEDFLRKIKLQYPEKAENNEETVRIGSKNNAQRNKAGSLSETSSFMNSLTFESLESTEDRSTGDETIHYSTAREYSENPITVHCWEKIEQQ